MENIEKASLSGLNGQKGVVYNDGELAFFDNMHDIYSLLSPIRLEIYVVVLVRKGRASVMVNGTTYEAKENDIFICSPNDILDNGMLSIDFEGLCICFSSAYVQRIIPLAGNSVELKVIFDNNPICALTPEEVSVFCQYYDLLRLKIQYTSSVIQKKVIDTIMLALVYDMQIVLNRVAPIRLRSFTARETIFKHFLDLLDSSYPKQRTVAYYADKLNITPKYLSSICKQVGNQKASDIIDKFVVKDIDYLMKHSSKSIKEIAGELDFPNLSFFGKYVKKHFGMSPKAYRAYVLEEASRVCES